MPGQKEAVQVPDAPAGTFVWRVVDHASAAPEQTLDAVLSRAVTMSTPGKVERYGLTCSRGGEVRQRSTVLLGRGQVRTLDRRRRRRG